MDSNELLTVDEAVELLEVPKAWIYERARTGALPVRKLGRHVRIPRGALADGVDRETGRRASDGVAGARANRSGVYGRR